MSEAPANVDLDMGLRMWLVDPEPHSEKLYRSATWSAPRSMRLERGVSVIYGQNGAGKSTFLDAWKSALSGRRGRLRVEMYMQIPHVMDAYSSSPRLVDRRDRVSGGEIAEDEDDVALPVPMPEMRYDPKPGSFCWPLWSVVDAAAKDWAAHNQEPDEALARAALSAGKIALVPIGVERAQWEVWLAADMTHEAMRPYAERARRKLSACRKTWDHLDDVQDDDTTTSADYDEAAERYSEAFESMVDDPMFRYLHQNLLDARSSTVAAAELLDEAEETGFPAHPVDAMPVPVALLGPTERLPWPQALIEVDDHTVDRMLIVEAAREVDSDGPAQQVGGFAKRASERANSLMGDLLPNTIELTANVAPRHEWLLGGALQWKARDLVSWHLPARRLSEFSAAQSRWARIAALLTTAPTAGQIQDYDDGNVKPPLSMIPGVPRVLILDEPEAHLHRSAERNLAMGLRRLARKEVDYLLVASHSPELLNVTDAHLHWANELDIRPFAGADQQRLAELGLLPSDLLGMTRVILLVEGHHEEIIFSSLIGDSLRRSGTYILPMNKGSRLASVADSQVLFDFTDATIIGLLDNLRAADVQSVWNDALALREQASPAAAVDHINRSLPGKEKSENIYMKQWLTKAISADTPTSRIVPFGLEKPDVLHYLPVKSFVPHADSWETLVEEHQAQIDSGKVKKPELVRNLKAWLTATKDARFTDDVIKKAIASLDFIPNDFVELAAACESASRRQEESEQ